MQHFIIGFAALYDGLVPAQFLLAPLHRRQHTANATGSAKARRFHAPRTMLLDTMTPTSPDNDFCYHTAFDGPGHADMKRLSPPILSISRLFSIFPPSPKTLIFLMTPITTAAPSAIFSSPARSRSRRRWSSGANDHYTLACCYT